MARDYLTTVTPDMAGRGAVEACSLGSEPVSQLQVDGVRFVHFNAMLNRRLADVMHVADDVIHARRALGSRVTVALLEQGEVAGYGWVSFDSIHIRELQFEVALPRGYAYIWDCVTLQPYRGRGIFPGLLRFMLEDLRSQGVVQVLALVAPGNVASLKSFGRAGFRLIAKTSLDIGHFAVEPTPAATDAEAAVLKAMQDQVARPNKGL